MRGDIIPDSDHVSRYCKPRSLAQSTGHPTGVSFMLRNGESYASVNWLEDLALSSRIEEIEEIKKAFANKSFTVAATGLFAVLSVGKTRNEVLKGSTGNRRLQFIHEPETESDDPSHSGIHGYSHEDNAIALLIADTVIETYNAR